MIDAAKIKEYIGAKWATDGTGDVIEQLKKFIAIPSVSPAYDAEWNKNGLQEKVVDLISAWVQAQPVEGLTLEVLREEGRTPLILIEVASYKGGEGNVLLYGHLDKQPPLTNWHEGLGPYKPVIRDGKLWGRGGADDGYSVYAAVTALAALQSQGAAHPRCVVIIEASEESGSPDLAHYMKVCAPTVGTPDMACILDSGAGNYEQMWLTASLRGVVVLDVSIDILKDGVHSGIASGAVPSTFRILRILLDRLEDPMTGMMKLPVLQAQMTEAEIAKVAAGAKLLGPIAEEFPFVEGAHAVHGEDQVANIMGNTWQATLSVTGMSGMPPHATAGNVLRPNTTARLSIRLPPGVDADAAYDAIAAELTRDAPYGAKITLQGEPHNGHGWKLNPLPSHIEDIVDNASKTYFGKGYAVLGEGGSIPFVMDLQKALPDSAFIVSGVLGPGNNAHGPNENLVIDYANRFTMCMAQILGDVATAGKK